MRFFSHATYFRTQLRKGGFRPSDDTPGTYDSIPGEYAQFEGGVFDTAKYFGALTEEQVIEKLRKHPDYGYGKAFWAEVDRPPSVAAEEELAILRAEVAALRKATAKEVVVVDKSAPVAEPVPFNELKSEAKRMGIKAERDWGREDYEKAIAAVKKEE